MVNRTANGELRHRKPTVYQQDGTSKKLIDGRYVVKGDVVGFRIAKYDPDKSLTIDPVVYSTYLGGTDIDAAHGIAVDSSGNAYVVGETLSNDFPVQSAFQSQHSTGPFSLNYDAFVSKFDPSGNLVYSTYLGGNVREDGNAIAVDSAGQAVITGRTGSLGFPVTANAFQQ